jgi:acyl carrier protein
MTLTREKLSAFLEKKMTTGDVAGDTALFSTGALDSVSQLDLIMLIESAAGITIDQADITLENMDSMDRILAFVEGQTRSTG